jgi:hypothetical protein
MNNRSTIQEISSLPSPWFHSNHPKPTDTLIDLNQATLPNGHRGLNVLQKKANPLILE